MGSYSVRKKMIQISVLIVGVIVLCGCGKWQKHDRTASFEKEIQAEPIYDSNPKNQYSCEKVKDGYEISLYNSFNEKIYSDFFPKEPTIRQVQENILEICISVGSPASYSFYFNMENCDISETYFNSMLVGDYYIAYMDNGELVLSDIFDDDIFYMKINRDFTKMADPMSAVINIELMEQENIRLTYFQGEDYTERTEIIALKGWQESMQELQTNEEDALQEMAPYYGAYKITWFWPYDYYDALKYERLPLEEADMMLGRIVEIQENLLVTCDSFRSVGARGGREAFTANYAIERITMESPCYEWEEFVPDTAWYEEFSQKHYHIDMPEAGSWEKIEEQYYQGIEGKFRVRVAGPIAANNMKYEWYHEYYVKKDGMLMYSELTGNFFYLEKLDDKPYESVGDRAVTEEEKEAVLQDVLGTYTVTAFLPTKFYPGLDSAGDVRLPREEADRMIGKEIIMERNLYATYDNGRQPNSEFMKRKMDEFALDRTAIENPEYRLKERCRDNIYGLRDDMLPEEMVQETYMEISVYPGFGSSQDRELPQLYLLDDGRLIMYAMSEYFLLERPE